jgi:hypothetical protein
MHKQQDNLNTAFQNSYYDFIDEDKKFWKIKYENPLLSSGIITIRKSYRMELGRTEFEVNGQTKQVVIRAEPYQDSSTLIISFLDENKNSLGGMKIIRLLYKDLDSLYRDNSHRDRIFEEDELLFSQSNVNVMKLYIYHCALNRIIDNATGDRPLMRLLVQVAVEVLSREPAIRLELNSVYDHLDVYAFMGLGSTSSNFGYERDELLEFRKETGLLFPLEYADKGGDNVSMDKMEYSKEHKTQYFKTLDKKKGLEPALIEYNPKETLTWEEQIQRKPVLNLFSGPLFWDRW